jgi:hypothetical protein
MKHKFIWLALIVFITSCKKEEGNGNMLVTVKYNGKALERASVYIERGKDTASLVPPKHYDNLRGADAVGQVYFDNLKPDTYTVFARGYSADKAGQVIGKTTVAVQPYSGHQYDIIVDTY